MLGKSPHQQQTHLFKELLQNLINEQHPLALLANQIPWKQIEEEFQTLYAKVVTKAHPIRKMVALLMLKYIYNLSDERVVSMWIESPYFQYFSGEATFQWEQPCAASDLVHFRKRIGKKGTQQLFAHSVALHADKIKKAREVILDTTVQEKNITFPTDAKLYKKIIDKCNHIAQKCGVKLRQSYRFVAQKLTYVQRYTHLSRHVSKARKALKRLRTLAGRQVRDLQRKLDGHAQWANYSSLHAIMERVVKQQRGDKHKIYSLSAPEVSCIAKGKVHKKYEFGSKVSVASLVGSQVIVGIDCFSGNPHDGKTLVAALDRVSLYSGRSYPRVLVDKGYRGHGQVADSEVIMPGKKSHSSDYARSVHKSRCKRRSAIEAVISHLKHGHRLGRNYLKGSIGDANNALLSGMGFNLLLLLRELGQNIFCVFFYRDVVFFFSLSLKNNGKIIAEN